MLKRMEKKRVRGKPADTDSPGNWPLNQRMSHMCDYKLDNDCMCDADEQSVDFIKHHRMRADDFIMIKCIGRGAFGEVQLVSNC